jgi:hypothetical protein
VCQGKNAKGFSYSKPLSRALMQTKTRNFVLVGSIICIITVVALFFSVVYSTSVKVELLDAYFNYRRIHSENQYLVIVTISVGNPNAFPVTVRDIRAILTVNGVGMVGARERPEERYVIPAFGWRQWTETFYAFGDYAEFLYSSETRQVLVDLRGNASCMFYETIFHVTSEKNY